MRFGSCHIQWTAAAAYILLGIAGQRSNAVDLIGYLQSYHMTDANYVDNVLPGQLAMLDEVRYFGITVDGLGNLTTKPEDLTQIQTLQQKINALPAAQRPRLDVTLGGAGLSSGFGPIAGSEFLRGQLAINVKSLLEQSGAAGVDIDWEHPDDGTQLSSDYPALLSRLKQEVGPTRRVYATVEPSKILPRSVFEGASAIDGVSIMAYDIGWWAGDPADPNLGEHSLPQYVDDAVKAWTNVAGAGPIPRTWAFGNKTSVDAPENKLGIAAPFYARGFNGTSENVAIAYSDLVADGTTSDGNAYEYQGSNVWITGPALVAQRIEYAKEHGLQHVIFWELFHDLPTTDPDSLLRAAFEANDDSAFSAGDFDHDHDVDGMDLSKWKAGFNAPGAATHGSGDADGDADADGADFLVWQRQVASVPIAAAVPEPGGLWLGAAAISGGAFARWRCLRNPFGARKS